jgi:hypothetical protein
MSTTQLARVGPIRDHKFAESVSLSSTALADFPLPGRALELGFDLLGFRARRKEESRGSARPLQGRPNTSRPQFAELQFSTFPQQSVQLVENRRGAKVRVLRVPHLRPPSVSHGVVSFFWGLFLGAFIWGGMLSVGVSGGTSFIIGAVAGFGIFLYVRVYGADEPRVSQRDSRRERAR